MYNYRVQYVFVFTTDKESLTTIRYALRGCNVFSNKMRSHIFLNRNNKTIHTFENPK
jgi:hypothetical protein